MSADIARVEAHHSLVCSATTKMAPTLFWIHNGDTTFTDATQRLGSASTEGIVLADLDGDGDLDAVAANAGNANAVCLNT